MDDLVRQLRRDAAEFDSEAYAEAADRIVMLEAALRDILKAWNFWQHNETKSGFTELSISIWDGIAALGEKKDD